VARRIIGRRVIAVNRVAASRIPSEIGPIALSAAQIKASLLGEMSPAGKAAKITALLKKHAYVLSFTVMSAGKVVIDSYYLSNGAHLASAKHKAKPVLVAVGRQEDLQAREDAEAHDQADRER
jgi:hypothetical protein